MNRREAIERGPRRRAGAGVAPGCSQCMREMVGSWIVMGQPPAGYTKAGQQCEPRRAQRQQGPWAQVSHWERPSKQAHT